MKLKTASLLVITALVLSACGGGDDPPPPRAQSPSPSPKPPVCPLTGEISETERVSRAALAVKIENSKGSRPQGGLAEADIVYEELAEGGITRFLAVFHCGDASRVGPVRSAREVDPDILLEYVPVLFGYSGANKIVLEKVRSTEGVIDLRHGAHGDAYERAKDRRAPSNLFTSTDELRSRSPETTGAPKTAFTFADEVDPPTSTASPSPGQTPTEPPGSKVSFAFAGSSPTRYVYDQGAGAYMRFHGDTPHTSLSGDQIRAVNVVVLKVQVRQGTIRDAAGNFSPEISVVGEGEAFVVRGGVLTKGKWRRPSLDDNTALVGQDGKPIPLLRGNTWIHLVPSEQPVNVE